MFNVGGPELLVILVVALIVLGPNKLPEAARQISRTLGEIKKVSDGFRREVQSAFEEPMAVMQPPPLATPAPEVTSGDDQDSAPDDDATGDTTGDTTGDAAGDEPPGGRQGPTGELGPAPDPGPPIPALDHDTPDHGLHHDAGASGPG